MFKPPRFFSASISGSLYFETVILRIHAGNHNLRLRRYGDTVILAASVNFAMVNYRYPLPIRFGLPRRYPPLEQSLIAIFNGLEKFLNNLRPRKPAHR